MARTSWHVYHRSLLCVCVCLLLQSFNNFGHLRKSATFFPILTEGERKLNLKHSVSSSMSTCLNLIMGPEISDLSLSQFWTFIWEVEVGFFQQTSGFTALSCSLYLCNCFPSPCHLTFVSNPTESGWCVPMVWRWFCLSSNKKTQSSFRLFESL